MPHDEREPILVAGAGIGGLAAALALLRSGRRVLVFEQGEQARESASGLVLWPNGVRALELLGLKRAQLTASQEFLRSRVCSFRGGAPWKRTPVADVASKAGAATLLLSREDLHRALREELTRVAGGEPIITRRRLVAVEQQGRFVRALFASGDTQRGAALIGADGIHSRVRRALFGDMPLHFQGRTSFRGIVTDRRLLPVGADMVEHHAPGVRFTHYAIGGGRSAWYASVLGRIPVTTRASTFLVETLGAFSSCVRELVASTRDEDIQRAAICDLPPLERWSQGLAALLGDAAHPMTPELSQGANQALEDAVVLGQELGRALDPTLALQRYQARRVPRVAPIVRASRLMGRMVNLPGELGFRVRELTSRFTPTAVGLHGVVKVAEHRFEGARPVSA